MSSNFDESGKNGPENLPAIVKSAILAKKLHRGAPLPTHLNIQQTLTNFLPNSSFFLRTALFTKSFVHFDIFHQICHHLSRGSFATFVNLCKHFGKFLPNLPFPQIHHTCIRQNFPL